jgi:hypothetical protein
VKRMSGSRLREGSSGWDSAFFDWRWRWVACSRQRDFKLKTELEVDGPEGNEVIAGVVVGVVVRVGGKGH